MISTILSETRAIIFMATLALTGLITAYFFILVAVQSVRIAASRIGSKVMERVLDLLYGYLLGEATLQQLFFQKRHRMIVIQSFAFVIASITGRLRNRMQRAFRDLDLVEPAQGWLRSPFGGKRTKACYLLGLIKSGGTTGLTDALEDRNVRVVSAAVIALGERGLPSTVPRLLNLFSHCSYPHAWLIAAVLPSFGSGVYPYVKQLLLPGRLSTEKLVLLLKVVADFKSTESMKELDLIYRTSDDLDVRISALNAIGKINDLAAVKTMFDTLTSEQWQLRATACRIVGDMSLKGAVYRLIPLIKDRNWYVRRNAVLALASLGKLGITSLFTYLDIDDRYARDMIVRVLEERGVIEKAVTDLADQSSERRREARRRIKLILDKGYREYVLSFRHTSTSLAQLMEEDAHA